MQFLRHMRDFFNLMYKIVAKEEEMSQTEGDGREEEEEKDDRDDEYIVRQLVTLSCVGVGFSNVSKGIMWRIMCIHRKLHV